MEQTSESGRPRDLVGAVIEGRYRLSAQLGGGAAGSVYRVEDLAGGAALAIKVWHASVLDPQTAGRFQRETRALSTLEHPNIVAIRDYGMFDGMPFLAMELLEGCSLETLVEGGALPVPTALAIASQMLKALAFAHERQVVHRDLKPDNVWLTPAADGGYQVKLLDFGLAKFLEPQADPIGGSALTKRGTLVGTPLYMAPEQALGRAIDKRTDVYAFGCVLFEMLAGQPPFMAENLTELLRAHLALPVPRLGGVRPGLPDESGLQQILDRALAKRADERFSDAGEMLRALTAVTLRAPAPAPAPAICATAKAEQTVPVAQATAAVAQPTQPGATNAAKLLPWAIAAAALCASAWWLLA